MRRFQLMIKRAIDIFVVVACLPFVFVASIVAVAIVQSAYPGWPIFVTQKRVGRDCRLFEMHKLRTMPVGHTTADDLTLVLPPRRIRVIRRLGIDELPQLIHVFVGTMSLIGNRPLIEEEWYARYGTSAAAIAVMSPGIISSLAIEAHRQSIGDIPMVSYTYDQLAVNLSLAYVTKWWLGEDLKIVANLIGLVASMVWQTLRREKHSDS